MGLTKYLDISFYLQKSKSNSDTKKVLQQLAYIAEPTDLDSHEFHLLF